MAIETGYLQQRSDLLSKLREFFLQQGFVEVETPVLAGEVIPELHIEPRSVPDSSGRPQWLQASPELHMKRLLAAGMESIFQLTRSFRGEEFGHLHHPEFTILEWYRVGDDLQAGMRLLDELMQFVVGTAPAKRTSYQEVFEQQLGINPHLATVEQLAGLGFELPEGLDRANRDEWLNFLLATQVESRLGTEVPEILYHYPASQAALARVAERESGEFVAERFELYWQGVELANGYHELTDPIELRKRLEQVNRDRQRAEKAALPLPESLLADMERGMPDCAGCALGVDRLVMLALGAESLDTILPFREA